MQDEAGQVWMVTQIVEQRAAVENAYVASCAAAAPLQKRVLSLVMTHESTNKTKAWAPIPSIAFRFSV